MKVLLKRFRLNGHTIGFHPQTQKLVKNHLLMTLGVKGLMYFLNFSENLPLGDLIFNFWLKAQPAWLINSTFFSVLIIAKLKFFYSPQKVGPAKILSTKYCSFHKN